MGDGQAGFGWPRREGCRSPAQPTPSATSPFRLYTSGVYLSSAVASEVRWMGETCTHFLGTGKTTNAEFCLVEETAKLGEAVPLHRHEKEVESSYMLEGEITFHIDGSPESAAAQAHFCMCLLGQSMGSGSRLRPRATLSSLRPITANSTVPFHFPRTRAGCPPPTTLTGTKSWRRLRTSGSNSSVNCRTNKHCCDHVSAAEPLRRS